MKPLPLIYIAGKFRGATPYDVRKNVEAARDYGLTVARLGGYPVIPHTMTADFDKQLTDAFWLAGTMELLRRCDGILLIPGWDYSAGARAEHQEAQRLGIAAFDSRVEGWTAFFSSWLEAWQANAQTRAAAAAPSVWQQEPPPAPRLRLASSPPTTAPASAAAASPRPLWPDFP